MKVSAILTSALLAIPALAVSGATLGWDGSIWIAQRFAVQAAGGGAPELWYATVHSDSGEPARSVYQLNNVTARFIVTKPSEKESDTGSTVEVTSNGIWGEWNPGKVVSKGTGHPEGAATFKLPLKVQLDDAEKIFRKATGSKALIEQVELIQPVTRFSPDQPAYYFTLADGTGATVGANDGKLLKE